MQLTEIESLQWPEVTNDDGPGKELETVSNFVRHTFATRSPIGTLSSCPTITMKSEQFDSGTEWPGRAHLGLYIGYRNTSANFLYCFVKLAEDNEAALCRPRTTKTRSAAHLLAARAGYPSELSSGSADERNSWIRSGSSPSRRLSKSRTQGPLVNGLVVTLEPNHDEKERMRDAFQLTTLLTLAESQQAARHS